MLAGSGWVAWGLASRGRHIAGSTPDHRRSDAGKFRSCLRRTGPPVRRDELPASAHGVALRRCSWNDLPAKGAVTPEDRQRLPCFGARDRSAVFSSKQRPVGRGVSVARASLLVAFAALRGVDESTDWRIWIGGWPRIRCSWKQALRLVDWPGVWRGNFPCRAAYWFPVAAVSSARI